MERNYLPNGLSDEITTHERFDDFYDMLGDIREHMRPYVNEEAIREIEKRLVKLENKTAEPVDVSKLREALDTVKADVEKLKERPNFDMAAVQAALDVMNKKIDELQVAKGEKGDPGEKGADGAQGPKGDKGDPGDSKAAEFIDQLFTQVQVWYGLVRGNVGDFIKLNEGESVTMNDQVITGPGYFKVTGDIYTSLRNLWYLDMNKYALKTEVIPSVVSVGSYSMSIVYEQPDGKAFLRVNGTTDKTLDEVYTAAFGFTGQLNFNSNYYSTVKRVAYTMSQDFENNFMPTFYKVTADTLPDIIYIPVAKRTYKISE